MVANPKIVRYREKLSFVLLRELGPDGGPEVLEDIREITHCPPLIVLIRSIPAKGRDCCLNSVVNGRLVYQDGFKVAKINQGQFPDLSRFLNLVSSSVGGQQGVQPTPEVRPPSRVVG